DPAIEILQFGNDQLELCDCIGGKSPRFGISNKAFAGFIDRRNIGIFVAGLPLPHEFLCRVPAPKVECPAQHFSIETAFNEQRTAARSMAPALRWVLTGLEMSAKNSEHASP